MAIVRRTVVVGVVIIGFFLIRGTADRAHAQSAGTVDAAVARSADDAEESPVGSVNLNSSALELVSWNGNQTVGLRFASLAVPRGATVVDAYVQFESAKATSEATGLFVQGQAIGNAPGFTTASRDVSARARTNAVVMWQPPAWSVVHARGVDQRTPDLSAVVGEIVRRADWAEGNALVVVITGSGKRVAESSDGGAAPVLHVEFTTDGSTTTTSTTTPSDSTAPASTTAPPGGEASGSVRAVCKFSHEAQVDPILEPGTPTSAHLHDFFGNRSTTAASTYSTMVGAGTTCTNPFDRAAYWAPALVAPDGTVVKPIQGVFSYRNRPTGYGRTVPFPPDFRMATGGAWSFPISSYWTCEGESDTTFTHRTVTIPNCGTDGRVKLHVFFPSCWDGQHLQSADGRSHVAFGLDDHGDVEATNPDTCPVGYPVKVPQLDFRVLYPVGDAAGYHLSDGQQLAYAEFWNTWVQPELERLVETCLHRGKSCSER